jgi:hypothetical protein
MWRDILIILGTGLTVVMFLQLNSRRLSKYAEVAKGEITKRNRLQKFFLIYTIAITPAFIFVVISSLKSNGLLVSLAIIAAVSLLWRYTLIDVWKLKLSQRGEKVVNIVGAVIYLAFLSLMIIGSVLSDSDKPLWQKLAPILGGTAGGGGIHYLNEYVNKKLEGRRLSKEEDK